MPTSSEKYKTQDECPDRAKHTKCPKGYSEWFDWAEEMEAKGYQQIQCPTCEHYSIWGKEDKNGVFRRKR